MVLFLYQFQVTDVIWDEKKNIIISSYGCFHEPCPSCKSIVLQNYRENTVVPMEALTLKQHCKLSHKCSSTAESFYHNIANFSKTAATRFKTRQELYILWTSKHCKISSKVLLYRKEFLSFSFVQ